MVETLTGTGSKDVLVVSLAIAHHVLGLAGDDSITGNLANDTLDGGAGNDLLDGGAGDDVILVGAPGSGFDILIGGAGIDTVLGSSGDDVIGVRGSAAVSGIETIDGAGGIDRIQGSAGNDVIDLRPVTVVGIASIDGGAGADTIFGSAAADILVGGAGNDRLDGGAGDDIVIYGGLFRSYVVTIAGGSITVDGTSISDGVDRLDNVEVVRFSNGDLTGGVFVDPDNVAPTAVDDIVIADEDTSIAIDVLGNDTDGNADALFVVSLGAASHGAISLNGDGTIRYVPRTDYQGEDTFTYTMSDGRGGSDTGLVRVTVLPVNDAPLAADDRAFTELETPVRIDSLANDVDREAHAMWVSNVAVPGNGSAVIDGDGAIVYTPNPGFVGIDTFSYDVTDALGGVASASVSVHVGLDPVPDNLFLDHLWSMPEGSWSKINNNDFSDVFPPAALRPEGKSDVNGIIRAWSSVAWNPNDDGLIAWGGGHAVYGGNDVYVFDARSLMWTRGSLASDIKYTGVGSHFTAIDGADAAPISSHTYDNNEFLPLADRFVTFGGAAFGSGGGFRHDDGVSLTGPYFWNPNLADPDKVGGTTGSHVNPELFPDIVGGNMWENRDTWLAGDANTINVTSVVGGTTAYAYENGREVIYLTENANQGARLLRYVIEDPNDASLDRWEHVGSGYGFFSGSGVGAYDPGDHVYVRTTQTGLIYWDTTKSGKTNKPVTIDFDDLSGTFAPSDKFGMDYDPVRDNFVIWNGHDDVWRLEAPDVLDSHGWTMTKDSPASTATTPPANSIGTGVFGKWKYLSDYDVFLAVTNEPAIGDVYVYKPTDWQAPPPEDNTGYTVVANADGAATGVIEGSVQT